MQKGLRRNQSRRGALEIAFSAIEGHPNLRISLLDLGTASGRVSRPLLQTVMRHAGFPTKVIFLVRGGAAGRNSRFDETMFGVQGYQSSPLSALLFVAHIRGLMGEFTEEIHS